MPRPRPSVHGLRSPGRNCSPGETRCRSRPTTSASGGGSRTACGQPGTRGPDSLAGAARSPRTRRSLPTTVSAAPARAPGLPRSRRCPACERCVLAGARTLGARSRKLPHVIPIPAAPPRTGRRPPEAHRVAPAVPDLTERAVADGDQFHTVALRAFVDVDLVNMPWASPTTAMTGSLSLCARSRASRLSSTGSTDALLRRK